VRELVNSVGNTDGVGGRDPYVVAAVVIEARANVVAASRVDGESFMAFSAFMGVDFDAGGSKRRFVKVEEPWIWALIDSFRLIRDGCRRLSVRVA
jgi:hypothetical protein